MDSSSDYARAARAALRQHSDGMLRLPNVRGCGVGRRVVGGRETDEPSVVVFVTRKLPLSRLREEEIVPRELEGEEGRTVTDVVEIAPPRLFDTAKYRPLVGGAQISAPGAASGGTLGAVLYDRTDDQPVLLTCNHCVTQAGIRHEMPADRRVRQPASSAETIGLTKRIVPWTTAPLGPANYTWSARVDAAIIQPAFTVDVAFKVVDLGQHPYLVLPPYEGLEVSKRGAATDTTPGTVKYIDVSVILNSAGQPVKIGGPDSGFAIRRIGGNFALPGDSGALVVDMHSGASRGIVFGGDVEVSGFTYACEMGAVMASLELDTPCTGGMHGMVRRAVLRRLGGIVLEVEGRAVKRFQGNMDRFRARHLPDEPDGRFGGALGSMFQTLAVELAEAIHADEDFAGLLDEAFGEWLVQPTVYDLLEYRLREDFGSRVLRAFDRLACVEPRTAAATAWLGPALAQSGGIPMRELLERRVEAGCAAPAAR